MKRPLLLALLLCSIACLRSFGQNKDTLGFRGFTRPQMPLNQNVLKSNIVPILLGQIPFCGEIRITYERMLAEHHSLELGASYNFPNLFLLAGAIGSRQAGGLKFTDFSVRGGRIIVAYRWYPLRGSKAPKGFFVGPFFSYNYAKLQEKHGNGDFVGMHYINGDIVCGYQVRAGNHFAFEVFGGLGYKRNYFRQYDAHYNTYSIEESPLAIPAFRAFKNVKFVLEMNFGYAF